MAETAERRTAEGRTAERPIFEAVPALPRGPHRLTRDEVAASQRMRLMGALTDLLAGGGYGAVTIGELARQAGVSRAAFYAHFPDKEACLLAAYDHFAGQVVEAITSGVSDDMPWTAFVEAAVAGYLGVLERDPVASRAFIVEMDAAGPAARARRREAIHGSARLLAQRYDAIRRHDPTLAPLPATAYLVLALGVRELARELLEGSLDGVAPEAVEGELSVFVRAIVEGTAAIRR